MFTRINPFFMTHGYNTPLLDYDITAADGTEDRGARTPAEMGNEITRKLSRGELHASKWCRRMKKRSIKEGKEKKRKNLATVDRYLHGKRGGVNSG